MEDEKNDISGTSINRVRRATISSKSIADNKNQKNKKQDRHQSFDNVVNRVLANAKKSPDREKEEERQEGSHDQYESAGDDDDHVNADVSEEETENDVQHEENGEENLEDESRDRNRRISSKRIIGNTNNRHNKKQHQYERSVDNDHDVDGDETKKEEGNGLDNLYNENESDHLFDDSGEEEEEDRKQASQKLTSGTKRQRGPSVQQRPNYTNYTSSERSNRKKTRTLGRTPTEFETHYTRDYSDFNLPPDDLDQIPEARESEKRWRAPFRGYSRGLSDFCFASSESAPAFSGNNEANSDRLSHRPSPQPIQSHYSFTALPPMLSGSALKETAARIAFERDELFEELKALKNDRDSLVSQLNEKDIVIRYLETVAGVQRDLPYSTATIRRQSQQRPQPKQRQKTSSIDGGKTNGDRDVNNTVVARQKIHPSNSGLVSSHPTIASDATICDVKRRNSSSDDDSISNSSINGNDVNRKTKSSRRIRRRKEVPSSAEKAIIRFLTAEDPNLTWAQYSQQNSHFLPLLHQTRKYRNRKDYLKRLRENDPDAFREVCLINEELCQEKMRVTGYNYI